MFAHWLPVTPLWYEVDDVGASMHVTEEIKKDCVLLSPGCQVQAYDNQPFQFVCLVCLRCTLDLIMLKERLMTQTHLRSAI